MNSEMKDCHDVWETHHTVYFLYSPAYMMYRYTSVWYVFCLARRGQENDLQMLVCLSCRKHYVMLGCQYAIFWLLRHLMVRCQLCVFAIYDIITSFVRLPTHFPSYAAGSGTLHICSPLSRGQGPILGTSPCTKTLALPREACQICRLSSVKALEAHAYTSGRLRTRSPFEESKMAISYYWSMNVAVPVKLPMFCIYIYY